MNAQPHLTSLASPPAKSQRRRLWRWLLRIAALVSLIVFLPPLLLIQWGPSLLGTVLSTKLHTSVTIEEITGGWLSGLELRGLAVAESPEPQAPTLLRVERITLNLPAVWLLFSSDPIALRLAELSVNLRRRHDGQWNIAPLLAHLHTSPTPAAPQPSKPLRLPNRGVKVTLTDGRLQMGDEGITYSVDLHAESPSLAEAPFQWHVALAGPENAALTFDGQIQPLTTAPEALVGHAAINGSHLDVAMVTALLSPHAAVQPRGVVQRATIGLVFTGTQGITITVSLDVQPLQWPGADGPTAATLARLQVNLHGQWQDNQWSCDTLTIAAPGARFTLHDRAWMRADQDAWHGHVAFALDVDDRQPVTQAIHPLLPPALRLQGPVQVAGQATGTVSRDAQQPWDARLTGLEASLDASLAGAAWHQETITTIVTKVFLKDGRLTIPHISARAFGSDVVLTGDLPLAAHTPGGEIDWHMVNLPLHKVLGAPLQRFDISQMSGRLTRDGTLYRVQSVVQFPELRLDPADISQREFRVTQAVFRCTATLTLPFTHLAFTGCTIESPEMRLTFEKGTLALGAHPEIAVQLKGDLDGKFVNALVPEAPVQFSHPLHVRGPYRIPLHGNVWIGMQWELTVTSDRFVFGDMPFTDLRTQVVKTIGRLNLADVTAQRGNGHIEASGSWRFLGNGQPAEGRLHMHPRQLPVQQTLVRDAPDEPYVIEATVDGPITLQTGHTGWQLTEELLLHGLRLRRESTTLAELSAARLHGLFGREIHGPLWARQLEILGEDLHMSVRHGRLPVQASEQAAFEVDATVGAPAPWVMAALALLQIKGVDVRGRTHAVVQVQGKIQDPFQTMHGGGAVQVAEVGFLGQTFTALDMAYELTPGRLQLTTGVLGYGEGTIEVQGSLGLPLRPGIPGDRGVVTLHQIPLQHTKPLQDFRSQGAATLHTRTTCNGHLELQGTPSGQLHGVLEVQVDETTRQIRQDDRVLEDAHIPPFLLTMQVASTRPHEHWEIPSLRLQGQGTTIALANMQVHSTSLHVDVSSAVQVHLSGEVSYGLTMGLFPEAFELKDTVDLVGTAGLRIPLTGPIEPRHISYVGDVHLESVVIEGDTAAALMARLRLAQGRLTVDTARAQMLDGEVSIPSASFVDLQGPIHDFEVHGIAHNLHLQVSGGKRLALSRVLVLLAPLFIIEPGRDQPASMAGVLVAEIGLKGRWSPEAGWSKTVNGDGFFRIVDGAIMGSTLVANLTTRTVALPWNMVHNMLTGLFAEDGQLGSMLANFGTHAFRFGTIESPIWVRAGEVHLPPNFAVRSPEFGMVLNGYSTLEGDLDYRVRTDIIERLRFGSLTSLPNRIPLIGAVLHDLNPFTLLEGIELEVTVKGNVFQHNDQGQTDVHVNTSIIR